MELLWSGKRVCRELGIGRTTLWKLTKQGQLASVKIGKCRRYDPKSAIALVERMLSDQERR